MSVKNRRNKSRLPKNYSESSEIRHALYCELQKNVTLALGHRVDGHINLETGIDFDCNDNDVFINVIATISFKPTRNVMDSLNVPHHFRAMIQRAHTTRSFRYLLNAEAPTNLNVLVDEIVKDLVYSHDNFESEVLKRIFKDK